MPTRRHLIALGAASVFVPSLVLVASASAWPDRTVHMVVPVAAGGPTDVNARILAEQLSKIWGQQVVIDNKGGAGTNIGNAFVAHSDPDGYTLLYGTSSLASNGALYRSLDYNPMTDLTPISLVAKFPFFMFVPNSSPAKSVKEFIDYVKAQLGKLLLRRPALNDLRQRGMYRPSLSPASPAMSLTRGKASSRRPRCHPRSCKR